MLDQIRSAIQIASSVAEIPKQQAERFAKDLVKRGDLQSSQVGAMVEDIVKRSHQNAQMIQSLVSSEMKRQIRSLGLATRDDLDRVNRRVFGLATKDEVDRLNKRLQEVEKKRTTAASPVSAKPVSSTNTPRRPPKKAKTS